MDSVEGIESDQIDGPGPVTVKRDGRRAGAHGNDTAALRREIATAERGLRPGETRDDRRRGGDRVTKGKGPSRTKETGRKRGDPDTAKDRRRTPDPVEMPTGSRKGRRRKSKAEGGEGEGERETTQRRVPTRKAS